MDPRGGGELVLDLQLLAMRDDENDQGYYEDVPVSQEEVRRLVLRSLQSDNPELLQKIKATTPKGYSRSSSPTYRDIVAYISFYAQRFTFI